MLLPNRYYIPYFWWSYIHSLFFILLWIPACLELVFLFLKKEFTLLFLSLFSFKEWIDSETSRKSYFVEKQTELRRWIFMGKTMHFPSGKVYHEMGICWKKSIHRLGKSILGSPNLIDFTAFSYDMGNWWGNPCISNIIRYIIECESNGKKTPILWEKYE